MKPIPLHYVWQYNDVDRAFWQEHLEAWVPAEVFDAHTHVDEPRHRLETPSEEKRRQHWVNEVCEPIAAADAQRCQELVFPGRKVSCLAFGIPLPEYDIEGSGASLQEECVRRGWQRLVVPRPQWSADRLAAELDQPQVVGVKPYYALIGPDPTSRDKYLEASIFEFLPHHQLEVLDDRHAWVTLHVPKADRLCHPDNIAEIREIRRRYPNIRLVIAHLGRCYTLPQAQKALPQLADDHGLFFDLSAVMNYAVILYALVKIGPGRLLYGTDNPVFYMRGMQRWRGTSYVNYTNHPFHFNRDRDPPEIEARYTLYMYTALYAIKRACARTDVRREHIEAMFHGNARRLIDQCNVHKAT
jgi:uncharacterized protein